MVQGRPSKPGQPVFQFEEHVDGLIEEERIRMSMKHYAIPDR